MAYVTHALRQHADNATQNFFDTTVGGVSLRTLFSGRRRSHGRANANLTRLWDF